MTADLTVLDRIFDRLMRALSAGGSEQLRAPFTVAEIVQALVPYRTYRNELGVDTLQDYEHAILELLAGERGWLVCDPDTVAVIRKELASPDPDTGLLRRLQSVEVRVGAVRLPALLNLRSPIARPDDDARDAKRSASATPPKVSDAIAIGAVMDREDAEIAEAAAAVAKVDAPRTPDDAAGASPKSSATKKSGSQKTPRATQVIGKEADTGSHGTAATVLPSVADLVSLVPADLPHSMPLHAVHGVTLASAQTLARITPLSVQSIYGDPIDFRGVRHAPVDIGGVIFLFGMVARELGFNVESMSSGFPRCEAKRQLAPGKWARLRIDFELESRQFRDAGRNPGGCDLIVCWRDTWPDRPASLDVLSLERMLPTLPSKE